MLSMRLWQRERIIQATPSGSKLTLALQVFAGACAYFP
jgi:hypothetical protein